MHPPEPAPSTADVHDAPFPTLPSSIASSSMATTTTSIVVGIATAASAARSSILPLASSTPSATSSTTPPDGENTGECKLLGPFAILVQGALGALALTSLVYKRWRERPQRPIKVWLFDVSKQVVGSILLHLTNLVMSMFSSGQIQESWARITPRAGGEERVEKYQPNPCSFYLLNLAIDTTIGIPILIGILRILTVGASYTCLAKPLESIESGNYGNPPDASWWLKQCLIYFLGLMGMKACVFVIFQLCPWLGRVGDWALRWTEGNEAIQIAFVMLIFPLIMNAVQYYIIDTFIKSNKGPRDELEEDVGDGGDNERGGLLAGEVPGHGRSIDEDVVYKADDADPKILSPRIVAPYYDPDKDGEVDTNSRHGGSSSLTGRAEEEAVEHRPRV
ncbi:uncharacterized protein Z518_07275 [Rhinocladiella mackenziei CBS 650.93]|uniref:Vacuolar membrane protein n=1 Tax=Rhinocladiella mackenziei CBS 650.93 TaxID=1442369 RepID=A0A0D2FNR5_9EURO|nr:uncharacterized protein Z518_07275 [Rhinocladiella mackenziei CBS 650.93]KIX03722.1 hypothetical protein Z518_07275 [Rhinocladiella mackenziei CBS 650.93]